MSNVRRALFIVLLSACFMVTAAFAESITEITDSAKVNNRADDVITVQMSDEAKKHEVEVTRQDGAKTIFSEEYFELVLSGLYNRGEETFPECTVENKLDCEECEGCRVYTLTNEGYDKIILYTHGGGWTFGISLEHVTFCDILATRLNAKVYMPLYPLSPQATSGETYTVIESVYEDVLKEGKPVYIAGDSAGGNITLGLMYAIKENNLEKPEKMILIAPCSDMSMSNEAMKELDKTDPELALYGCSRCAAIWAGEENLKDPKNSAVYADVTGYPDTMIIQGTNDILYPDNMILYGNLKNAGVNTTLVIGEGLWHVFPVDPIPERDEVVDIIEEFCTGEVVSMINAPKNLACTYKELTDSCFTVGTAKIQWNGCYGATGYEVYSLNDGNYELIGTTDETSFTLENLKEGKTYTIVVRACNDSENTTAYSDYSESLEVNVSKQELGVRVYNGNMIGTVTNGVYSFKGIHYAKDTGTPETRWKKPVPVDASDEDVDASEYGKVAFQVPWHSEASSMQEQSEDCLTLDVWTSSPNDTTAKKPVFVWIHGGSNILGGSSDPLYTGQHIIETCGDDVVYVAINYRLNCMGVMNFSQVEGGGNYPDSGWISLYDDVEALRWIQKNIEKFGGDPEQVTIAGESNGGTHVTMLALMEECKEEGLFNKVISQSGGILGVTPEENSYNPTKVMLDGYKYDESVATEEHAAVKGLGRGEYPTMDDLANLSSEDMWTLMFYCGCCSWDEETQRAHSVTESAGDYSVPIRGGQDNPLLNARFDGSLEKMAEKYQELNYFDLLVGTTANEYDYWIGEMSNKYLYDENGNAKTYIAFDGSEKAMVEEGALPSDYDYAVFNASISAKWNSGYKPLLEGFGIFDELDSAMDKLIEGNTGAVKGISEDAMKGSTLASQIWTVTYQMFANYHSKSDRSTYMYHWRHPSDVPGINAGHAVELSYVFGVSSDEYYCPSSGTTDAALMDKTLKTWMSFVKDGKPTVANQNIEWPEYDEEKKATMIINDTSKNPDWTVEENPDKEVRDLIINKDGTQDPLVMGDNQYTSFMDFVMRGLVIKEANQ